MAGAHVQIYLWTFDRGWPQKYIIQKFMSDIYDVKVEVNSLIMCSWDGLREYNIQLCIFLFVTSKSKETLWLCVLGKSPLFVKSWWGDMYDIYYCRVPHLSQSRRTILHFFLAMLLHPGEEKPFGIWVQTSWLMLLTPRDTAHFRRAGTKTT
jgi:hypothetical protein